eukprot:gene20102-26820_t
MPGPLSGLDPTDEGIEEISARGRALAEEIRELSRREEAGRLLVERLRGRHESNGDGGDRLPGDDRLAGDRLPGFLGGGGSATLRSFQDRFRQDMMLRDMEREAVVQSLMGGGDTFMQQQEEMQMAMAIAASLADGGASGGAPVPPALRDTPAQSNTTAHGSHVYQPRFQPGPFGTASVGGLAAILANLSTEGGLGIMLGGPGMVIMGGGMTGSGMPMILRRMGPGGAGDEMSYEHLLELEDVKVTTPKEVVDAMPWSKYDKAGSEEW